MKYRVSLVMIVDVERPTHNNADYVSDDVLDSLTDTLNDAQDIGFETSDEKFVYTPGEIKRLTIEPIEPD